MRFIILTLLLSSATAFAAVTGIEPEIPAKVELSSIDLNRIVCPNQTSVTNIADSAEKGLQLKASGENLFVKFPVIETENGFKKERVYYNGVAEIFMTCGNSVYSLILSAKKIPGQTVYLSGTASDMKKANEYVTAKSDDDLMLDLIDAIINNRIPKGFRLKETELIEEYKGISISSTKELVGGGYRVRELVLKSDKQVSITDLELIKLKILKNVKAVAITSPVFVGVTTGYVVEGVVK
ncbi:MAG: type-F conjugative transfer system secretin TraK [Deferribacterales bacterium]